MKNILSRLVIGFFFAIAVFVAVKDKETFNLKDIKITNNIQEKDHLVWRQLTDQIDSTLNKSRGTPIWKISLLDIKEKMAEFPQVRNLQVQKLWPDGLEVNYSLPRLKVIYQTNDNQYKLLADDGNWFGPVKWSRLPGLPWVRGEWIIKFPDLKENLLSLLQQLPQKGTLALDQISDIQFNQLDGFLVTMLKSGQQVRFGTDNFDIKSLRVAQVLEYLQNRSLESRVIDANFSKKVLVRLRNHP